MKHEIVEMMPFVLASWFVLITLAWLANSNIAQAAAVGRVVDSILTYIGG